MLSSIFCRRDKTKEDGAKSQPLAKTHDKAKNHTKILHVSDIYIEDVSYFSLVDKKQYNSS